MTDIIKIQDILVRRDFVSTLSLIRLRGNCLHVPNSWQGLRLTFSPGGRVKLAHSNLTPRTRWREIIGNQPLFQRIFLASGDQKRHTFNYGILARKCFLSYPNELIVPYSKHMAFGDFCFVIFTKTWVQLYFHWKQDFRTSVVNTSESSCCYG